MAQIDGFIPHEQLIYRGEGNSSLVVAINSTSQVIRLLKTDAKKLMNANDVLSHLLQHIDFNENTLIDILPGYLFSPPKLICLNPIQLESIKDFVKDKRPIFRLRKTLSNCGYALLMEDYCTIPSLISYNRLEYTSIAIEIKPKQGYIPNSSLFPPLDLLKLKAYACRFGLSQFFKFRKVSIRKISSYCPLDLFSGCPSRMFYSLLCLIENPQNNFRIFFNSHLIYGDQKSIQDLASILEEFFLFRRNAKKDSRLNEIIPNYDQSSDPYYPIVAFCFLLMQILLKPLCGNENVDKPKIFQSENENDHKHFSNLFKEYQNLNHHNKYVFFRTFIQLFEKISRNPLETVQRSPDGQYDDLVLSRNIFSDLELARHYVSDDGYIEDLFPRRTEAKKKQLIAAIDRMAVFGKSKCLVHRDEDLRYFNFDFKCKCKNSNQHSLPPGSILNSILDAQKLDKIDSHIAVKIFNKLYLRYKELKQRLRVNSLYPLNDNTDSNDDSVINDNNHNNDNTDNNDDTDNNNDTDNNDDSHKNGFKDNNDELHKHLEQFIMTNIEELDTLWRFLISLTAKDCSIMIALKSYSADDCDDSLTSSNDSAFASSSSSSSSLNTPMSSPYLLSSASSSSSSSPYQSQESPCTFDLIDEATGLQYLSRISIVDLDLKSACKIQRTMHNDQRMIHSFLSYLRNSVFMANDPNLNNEYLEEINRNPYYEQEEYSISIPDRVANIFTRSQRP